MLVSAAGFLAFGFDTIAAARVSTRCATFATTHGVIHWVHNNGACTWAAAFPTIPTGFTHNFEVVIGVANGTDRSLAG